MNNQSKSVNLSIPQDFILGIGSNLVAEAITRVVSSDSKVLNNIQRNQVILNQKLDVIIELLNKIHGDKNE